MINLSSKISNRLKNGNRPLFDDLTKLAHWKNKLLKKGAIKMTNNYVHLVGNLTKDVALRKTSTGKAVAQFSIGTTIKYGEKEYTEFVNIVVWGDLATQVNNSLHKGSRVIIEGRLQTRTYETKTGEKRYITEVVAYNVTVPLPKSNFETFGDTNTEEIPF